MAYRPRIQRFKRTYQRARTRARAYRPRVKNNKKMIIIAALAIVVLIAFKFKDQVTEFFKNLFPKK